MSVFKCKMCGGELSISEGVSVCECEYCGSRQTVPNADDEKKIKLFERANRLRFNSEFDKAAGVYESLLADFPEEAEAYWGNLLCKYGIEYVDDPATGEKVPTCHRSSFESLMDDPDFEMIMEYADPEARPVYRDQAKAIEEVRRGILEVSGREQPYDLFICYKETAEDGQRTLDSVLAQDVYDALTAKGYRTFFSRITLEDKLGTEYEPYIFAALNSAKVMLAFGTSYDYYSAVWVKNEWSRFLKLMEKDKSKHLIPCFKGIDAYDMPKEFARFQAQDMGKVGAVQDLLRGISKILYAEGRGPAEKETVAQQIGTSALIKRGNMALEDGDWAKADSFFEEALNQNPECAEAYLGKLLAAEKLVNLQAFFQRLQDKYAKVESVNLEAFPADEQHIKEMAAQYVLGSYLPEEQIRNLYKFSRNYISYLPGRKKQKATLLQEVSENRLLNRAKQYAFGDLNQQLDDCLAELTGMLDRRIADAEAADQKSIADLKAAYAEHLAAVDAKIPELRQQAEAAKAESESKAEEQRLAEEAQAKKTKKFLSIAAAIAVVLVMVLLIVTKVIIPANNYRKAVALYEYGSFEDAIVAFEELGEYKDSTAQIETCKAAILERDYNAAVALYQNGQYKDSAAAFDALGDYKDSADQHLKVLSDKEYFSTADKGTVIVFGSYEQDNDANNGQEPIEWRVLAKENGRLLVISEYGLDAVPFNTEYENKTWAQCTLRTWLNVTFLKEAFSSEEQSLIATTNVTADKTPQYSTIPGNATNDKVFLLSAIEAEKYFTSDQDRQAASTVYAIARGAWTSNDYQTVSGEAACWWWLRSPGRSQSRAAAVDIGGSLYCAGRNVNRAGDCVRPALWINLDS